MRFSDFGLALTPGGSLVSTKTGMPVATQQVGPAMLGAKSSPPLVMQSAPLANQATLSAQMPSLVTAASTAKFTQVAQKMPMFSIPNTAPLISFTPPAPLLTAPLKTGVSVDQPMTMPSISFARPSKVGEQLSPPVAPSRVTQNLFEMPVSLKIVPNQEKTEPSITFTKPPPERDIEVEGARITTGSPASRNDVVKPFVVNFPKKDPIFTQPGGDVTTGKDGTGPSNIVIGASTPDTVKSEPTISFTPPTARTNDPYVAPARGTAGGMPEPELPSISNDSQAATEERETSSNAQPTMATQAGGGGLLVGLALLGGFVWWKSKQK